MIHHPIPSFSVGGGWTLSHSKNGMLLTMPIFGTFFQRREKRRKKNAEKKYFLRQPSNEAGGFALFVHAKNEKEKKLAPCASSSPTPLPGEVRTTRSKSTDARKERKNRHRSQPHTPSLVNNPTIIIVINYLCYFIYILLDGMIAVVLIVGVLQPIISLTITKILHEALPEKAIKQRSYYIAYWVMLCLPRPHGQLFHTFPDWGESGKYLPIFFLPFRFAHTYIYHRVCCLLFSSGGGAVDTIAFGPLGLALGKMTEGEYLLHMYSSYI